MKSYSLDLRKRLVAGRRRGQSAEELARLFGVSKRSVERFWKRYEQEGALEPKQRGGYCRSCLEGHDERLRQWIAQQPDLSLEEMRGRLAKQLDIRIGPSCNPLTRSICPKSELAKKPPECLEYIVVHEMTHLLEPTHNKRFIALMDHFLPKWQAHRDALNRLPVRHEDWLY